jgi:hypothetical protein
MAEAFDTFEAPGVVTLTGILLQVIKAAARFPDVQIAASELIRESLAVADGIANIVSVASEVAIIGKIQDTQARNRPTTGEMETHIASTPGPFGTVHVGLTEELDKIVNPISPQWGQFWQAQEYGTTHQKGREIFGTFYESEEPPELAQQGLGKGHDIAFIPMGSAPGLGRIGVELPARHFLTDGTMAAGERYLKLHAVFEKEAVAALDDMKKMIAAAAATGGGFLGVIEM